jgi:hypothetical protein
MEAPFSQAEANAVERIKLRPIIDARHYGGRRTRLVKDKQELAERMELENQLLLLARRAIRKNADRR